MMPNNILGKREGVDRMITELSDLEAIGTRLSHSKLNQKGEWERNQRCQAKKSLAIGQALIGLQRDPISEALPYYDICRKVYQELQETSNEGSIALKMGKILYKSEHRWPAKVYFLSGVRLLIPKIESGDYSEKELHVFVSSIKFLARCYFTVGLGFKFVNAARLMELYSVHGEEDEEVVLCMHLRHAVNNLLETDHQNAAKLQKNIEQFQCCLKMACDMGDTDYELAIALMIKERYCHGKMYEEALKHVDTCLVHSKEQDHDIQAELLCARASILRTITAHDMVSDTYNAAMEYVNLSPKPKKRCQIEINLGRHIVSQKLIHTHKQASNPITSEILENNRLAEQALVMARTIVDPVLTCVLLKNLALGYIRLALITEPAMREENVNKAEQYLHRAKDYAKIYGQRQYLVQIETLLVLHNIVKLNQPDHLHDVHVQDLLQQVEEYETLSSNVKWKSFEFIPHGILSAAYTVSKQCPEKIMPLIERAIEHSAIAMTGDDNLNRSIFRENKNIFQQLFKILNASEVPDEDKVGKGLELLEAGRAQAFLQLLKRTHSDVNEVVSTSEKMSGEEIIYSLRKRGVPTLIYLYQPYDRYLTCMHFNGEFIGLKTLDLPEGGYSALQKAIVMVRNAVIRNKKRAEERSMEFVTLGENRATPSTDGNANTEEENATRGEESSRDFLGSTGRVSSLSTTDEARINTEHQATTHTARCKIPDFEEDDYGIVNDTESALKLLHSCLVQPLTRFLDGPDTSELLIIPMDELFLVPFAALQDNDGNYLGNKFRVRLTPSIQALELVSAKASQMSNSQHKPDCLIVGNPDIGRIEEKYLPPLPFAEQEAKQIASWLRTEPLIGKQATKSAVLSKMVDATLIHIATHGSSKDGSLFFAPDVVLSSETSLISSSATTASDLQSASSSRPHKMADCCITIDDVMSLKLEAKLVVLSACNTGRGDVSADGVFGISRAFMAAGALSVLVTLWAIPDEATKIFMEHFYSNLKAGDTVGKALQKTRISMQQTDKFNHPMNWGSFQLMGHNPKLFSKGEFV